MYIFKIVFLICTHSILKSTIPLVDLHMSLNYSKILKHTEALELSSTEFTTFILDFTMLVLFFFF